MFKRIDHVEIIPSDFQRTMDFYIEVLGFRTKERLIMEGGPLQEIAYLTLGDTMIELLRMSDAAPAPAAPFTVGFHGLALEVDDMEQATAYLRERDVPIVWGPMNLGASIRAELRDPDGMAIELRQWLQ